MDKITSKDLLHFRISQFHVFPLISPPNECFRTSTAKIRLSGLDKEKDIQSQNIKSQTLCSIIYSYISAEEGYDKL